MFNNNNGGYEQQAKFIQNRITSVEKNFAELCSAFGDYTRRTAKLRDMGDEVAKVVKGYADSEKVNKSLSNSLASFAVTLSAIEEYRNIQVQRLENKVMGELSQYDSICKHAREELKHTMSARDRELSRRRVLDRARDKQPFNRQTITYAESELMKASAEMSRTARSLGEQTEFFERKKLEQLKTLFTDFVKTEMVFHAKALELFTLGFQQINDINIKGDLENFRRKLKSPEKTPHPALMTRSRSLGSLMNNQDGISGRKHRKTYSNSEVEEDASEDPSELSVSTSNSESDFKKR